MSKQFIPVFLVVLISFIALGGAMNWAYKQDHTFGARQAESLSIRTNFPDRVPVIVEKAPNSNIPDIDRSKFNVPSDFTVAQFMSVIKKRIQASSFFIFVNEVLPPTTSATMMTVYDEHKDADGFLYVAYSGENTLGKR